eukprot:366341-Chlamydomonas_euryale.AAC.9
MLPLRKDWSMKPALAGHLPSLAEEKTIPTEPAATSPSPSQEKISISRSAPSFSLCICHPSRQAVLDAGVNLTEVYVDTVGDAERYQARLSQRFNTLKFTGLNGRGGDIPASLRAGAHGCVEGADTD